MSKLAKLISRRNNPVVKSIGTYTFTNFFSKAVSFLLLFLYTNPAYISVSENGLLSLMSTAIIFIMPFVSMGVLYSISTDFFKLNKKDFQDFFTTTYLIPVIITLVCCLGLFLFREQLKITYGFPYAFAWIIPAIAFFTFCNEHLINLIRNNNEPSLFLRVNLSKTILELGISVVLVFFFSWRWKGRVAGILIAYVFSSVYALYYFRKKGYLFGQIKWSFIRAELIYALPIVAMQASIFCMSVSDKFFLSYYTRDNNETVAVYSIATTFATIIIVLSGALLQYIFPRVYTQLSSAKPDFKMIRKDFRMYLIIMITGIAAILSFAPVAYAYFINEKYYPGLKYVFILSGGYLLWSISYFFYSFLLYNKEKKKIFLLSLLAILFSLACNWFFIKFYGVWGAVISNTVIYFIVFLLTLIFTRPHWQRLIMP